MKQTGLIALLLLVPLLLLAKEDGWKTQLGLSYVNTSGNTETETFSGKLDVNGAGMGNRYILGGTYMYGKNGDIENVNKLNADARAERIITGRLFAFVGASYLKDKYSGYDSRMAAGPGLGMDILKQETQTLKGLASSMYYFDDYAIPDLDSENYATGKAGLTYDRKIREHVTLKALGDYMVSLEETDRYFLTGDISIQVGISSRVALGLGYQINYQNTPPDPAIRKTDTSFLSSLVINW
jgi:putative salt-induced outer membrane protein